MPPLNGHHLKSIWPPSMILLQDLHVSLLFFLSLATSMTHCRSHAVHMTARIIFSFAARISAFFWSSFAARASFASCASNSANLSSSGVDGPRALLLSWISPCRWCGRWCQIVTCKIRTRGYSWKISLPIAWGGNGSNENGSSIYVPFLLVCIFL